MDAGCPFNVEALHRSETRHVDYRALAPFTRFDDQSLIAIVDPAIIDQVFRSEKFRVVDYRALYSKLSERTGIDFSTIEGAFDHIPLAQEGERHRQLREQIAKLFGATSRRLDEKLRPTVQALVERVFRPGAEVDLLADVAVPMFDAAFSTLLDVERTPVGGDPSPSQIFDAAMSLNRRKRMEATLRALRADMAGMEAAGVDPDIALALNILGQDAMVGAFAVSLWHDFRVNEGRRLNDVAFSATLPATSVAFIDRVAREDVEIGALAVRAGEVVRLFLDATTIEARGEDAGLLFGKGRHLCLGKPVALAAWRILTQAFSAAPPLTFSLDGFEARKGDHVFIYPERAVVRIGA